MSMMELAARCEAATGGDRQLDEAIRLAVGGRLVPVIQPWTMGRGAPLYTSSLDAAMGMVDNDGCSLIGPMFGSGMWQATTGQDGEHQADARSPALALCAAALRARAAQCS